MTARPGGRTPEGIYGLIGNVSEYLYGGDPKDDSYFNLGSRTLGGGFTDGRALFDFNEKNARLHPRNDYWGYSHHTTNREADVGFRPVLDPTKNADLVKRRPPFKQINEAWMTEDEQLAPEDKPVASPDAARK